MGDSERQTVLQHLPSHLRLPVAIGLYTGMREGDVLRLPRNVVAGNCINIITSKRLVAIDIHILPGLRQALREMPKHDAITLCANSRGRPWTESGFRASFRKELKKLEEQKLIHPGLTFHGLRHTFATMLVEAGMSAEDEQPSLDNAQAKWPSTILGKPIAPAVVRLPSKNCGLWLRLGKQAIENG